MHHVVILSFFLLVSFAVVFNLSFLNTYMDLLRVGSLNINGGRDRHKLALVSEVMLNKSYMSFYCRKLIVILRMK